eukprot:TRINITY_DN397_c1_g1_i1.p1 TRINITY_DN397_c1_g1~~TRINITY_DN397_c1_g1_i1.p1  ORF type:complete len:490 (-),score=133.38 TRINITY_DN397_c1_g1_i1:66-1535(-)
MEEGAERSRKFSITGNPMHSSHITSDPEHDHVHDHQRQQEEDTKDGHIDQLAKNTDTYFTSEQLWELFPFPASFGDPELDEVPLTLDPERLEFLAQIHNSEKMDETVVQRLKEFMFSASPGEILAYQDRAMQNICGASISREKDSKSLGKKMRGKIREWNEETGGDFTFVKLSKYHLDFGISGNLASVNVPFKDSFTITNKSKRPVTFSIQRLFSPDDCVNIEFNPSQGSLKKGQKITIGVSFMSQKSGLIKELMEVRIRPADASPISASSSSSSSSGSSGSGSRLFLSICICMKHSSFGVCPFCMPSVIRKDMQVPRVLNDFVDQFFALKAHKVELILRLAADSTEVDKYRNIIDKGGRPDLIQDVHVLGTLLKQWYRDLPHPILGVLDDADVKNVEVRTGDPVVEYYKSLKKSHRILLDVALEIAVAVVENESETKMGAQSVGIVLAPNMFRTGNLSDPMTAVVASQKMSLLMTHLIEAACDRKLPA